MKTKTLLWLDDTRNPFKGDWLVFNPIVQSFDCVWVKSYYEFVEWIEKNGIPDGICFDHDLGDTESEIEMTGYDCAKWLVNYCMENGLMLPKWNIQSANSVGKKNIDSLLKNYLKHVERKM